MSGCRSAGSSCSTARSRSSTSRCWSNTSGSDRRRPRRPTRRRRRDMMLDYETLRVIWWALLGILLIGFAVTDGYDLGAGMLLPFAARSDAERRQMLESIEPHWEGHQVWLITGAGVSFAAWPLLYATAFSGFYLAMFVVLAAVSLIVLFVLAGLWVAAFLPGYEITSDIARGGPSNPLAKTVAAETGSWLRNYGSHRWMLVAPALAIIGALGAALLHLARWPGLGLLASAAVVAGVVATAGVSMFPFLLPSSSDPRSSLTVWDSSSSRLTLFIMLIVTAIFLPIIVLYTGWALRVMRGRVTLAHVEAGEDAY